MVSESLEGLRGHPRARAWGAGTFFVASAGSRETHGPVALVAHPQDVPLQLSVHRHGLAQLRKKPPAHLKRSAVDKRAASGLPRARRARIRPELELVILRAVVWDAGSGQQPRPSGLTVSSARWSGVRDRCKRRRFTFQAKDSCLENRLQFLPTARKTA